MASPSFKQEKMVGWYNIQQLGSTAIRAIISSVFGSYADKRETMAAIASPEVYTDYSNKEEIWLDYISDTGDGFDSTYSLMALISSDVLNITGGQKHQLPKADLLIFGGDQVYPTASREEYTNRFIGPMEYASAKSAKSTDLFIVPGNHDWYDGLTNFVKLFCRKRQIGTFKTKQSRSYFAIQVRPNVWLWAIDIQLEADIDTPQLHYFDELANTQMKKGDKVILCTAEPSWIYNTLRRVDTTYINLEFFEEHYILKKGFQQIVTLAGDLHHYARYERTDSDGKTKHKITSGGGGAFLHPTHNLPPRLTNMHDGDFELKNIFPSKGESKKLSLLNFLFPIKNLSFGFFIAVFYLVLAYSLRITSSFDSIPGDLFDEIKVLGLSDVHLAFSRIRDTFFRSFTSMLILVVFAVGFYKFCDSNSSNSKHVGIVGLIHGLLHIVLMLLTIWGITYFNYSVLQLRGNLLLSLLVAFEIFIVGGILSGLLVGIYLWFCNSFLGIHDNEAFSSLKIGNYKNFLRIHIKNDILTIYPLGIRKTAKWTFEKDGFEADREMIPELLEEPIRIPLK